MRTQAPELKTQWLATLEGEIAAPAPISEGLMVFNVLSASIEGPRLKARVVQPSGDWIRVMPDGNWRLDVRLLFETDDKQHIYCYYSGVLKMTETIANALATGASVGAEDMYFRSAPYFETSAPEYQWLNDILCIGSMRNFGAGRAVYDLYEVL